MILCLNINQKKSLSGGCQSYKKTEKLKRNKSPGNDKIKVKLIEAGVRTFRSEIHKFINYIWSTEELPEEWKE